MNPSQHPEQGTDRETTHKHHHLAN